MIFLLYVLFSFQPSIHTNVDGQNLAISGYDPVSYFLGEEPVEGKAGITYAYRGAVYQFFSTRNRSFFSADPEGYVPQYGGWCAYAMGADAEKVKIDPETFKIRDGKLFLFYNFWGNNTLKDWNKDENNLRKEADINWKRITKS